MPRPQPVRLALLLVLVAGILLAAANPAVARTPCPGERSEDPQVREGAIFCLTNELRVLYGASPLVRDGRLDAAAREHSRDMEERDFFAHRNPDGETPSDRAARHGYADGAGENIAWNYRTARRVVIGWMASGGHCRNILSSYEVIGVGSWTTFDTQKFGGFDGAASPHVSECPLDPDLDGDGHPESKDNCPDLASPDLADLDGDGIGNQCDPDRDGDDKPNEVDLYPDENDHRRPPVTLRQPAAREAGRSLVLEVAAAPTSKLTLTLADGRSLALAPVGKVDPTDPRRSLFAAGPVTLEHGTTAQVTDGVSTARRDVTVLPRIVVRARKAAGGRVRLSGTIAPASPRLLLAAAVGGQRFKVLARDGRISASLRPGRSGRLVRLAVPAVKGRHLAGSATTRIR